MPEVLRQNAAPVAEVFLRSAALSPAEIEVVRKLVGHSIAVVECGLICETLAWRGGNRTLTLPTYLAYRSALCATRIHLFKRLSISLSEPSRSLTDGLGVQQPLAQMDERTNGATHNP